MFYYLSGELVMLTPTAAAVDCSGVAYKVNISGTTYNELSKKGLGKTVKVFTYLAVREDAMELYGFYDESELDAFTMLITVSGVGPKAASSILSAVTPDGFAAAVSQGDFRTIAKANGVGPKTAQRVILELKDKITKKIEGGEVFAKSEAGAQVGSAQSMTEAINALCVLGYTRQTASDAVSKSATPDMSLEDMITAALKRLSK